MTITIVQFNDENLAKEKLLSYDQLAGFTPPYTLTNIIKHDSLPIWFFSGTDCVENGGLNKEAIQEDINSLATSFVIDLTTYPATFTIEDWSDLVGMGYLPTPQPPNI